jgi:hypothetical protein
MSGMFVSVGQLSRTFTCLIVVPDRLAGTARGWTIADPCQERSYIFNRPPEMLPATA